MENKKQNFIAQTIIEAEQLFVPNKITNNIDTITTLNFSWKDFFNVLWITGTIIYLSYQIICYIYFLYKSFQWSRSITDKNILTILEETKKEQNIKTKINLRYSYFVTSPLLVSCLSPTILLPNDIKEENLNYIFRHELCHYKYCDLLLQRFRLIVQSLYWFNPVVWHLNKRADQDMERACDFYVLNLDKERRRKAYANTIFYVASLGVKKSQSLTTNFGENKKEMYYRIEEIMDINIRKKGILLFLFVATAVIFLNLFVVYTKSAQSNEYLETLSIPLKDTLKDLGFTIEYVDKNFIKASNNDKEINFANEYNQNLKKNKNTYFMEVIYSIPFIMLEVLKDLGYKIQKDEDEFVIKNNNKNVVINTNAYMNIIVENATKVEEHELGESTHYYRRKIIKKDIDYNQISDYKMEDVNLMGYAIDELQEYIEANYDKTLSQYKNDLININDKYSLIINPEYTLLDNGFITVLFSTNIEDIDKEQKEIFAI